MKVTEKVSPSKYDNITRMRIRFDKWCVPNEFINTYKPVLWKNTVSP